MTSLSDYNPALPDHGRPMFPHTVDSTILSAFRSCRQKAMLQYVEHWKAQAKSVHLVAGGAFASGIEAARVAFYVHGQSADDAEAAGLMALIKHYGDFECPAESAKSLERMCGALEFYFQMYPLGNDGAEPITLASGRRGIEFSFALPLGVNHPVTGQPILYTGRSDMIAERAGGIYIYDEKTTSSLGSSWSNQWEMRGQFTGYCLLPGTEVLTLQGWKAIETLIPGEAVAQWEAGNISFAVPSKLHSPQYKGKITTCDGKVAFAATPDHRQIVWDTYSQSYKDYTTATLPKKSGAIRFISAGFLQGNGSVMGPDFARLLVAMQADGSWKDGTAMSFHFSKERKAERLRELLTALGEEFSEHNTSDGTYSFRVSGKSDLGKAVHSFLGPNKLFGNWLLSFSSEELQAFIDEVQYWDGTSRGSRGSMYFSTVESNADWVRTVAALTGHYTSMHYQGQYRVNITEGHHHSPHLHTWGEIDWDGQVYCLTVPTSYFLIRTGGKVMVTGNCWAARENDLKPAGCIVRGVSILKTKYDTLEVPTYRSDYEIDLWYAQTLRDVQAMIQCWREGYWDYALDGGCTEYGGCSFTRVCKSAEPESWLPVYFERRVWDPLAREETTVAEYEASWGHVRSDPSTIPAAPTPQSDSAELQDSFQDLLQGMKR